jgi:hypothetical protein
MEHDDAATVLATLETLTLGRTTVEGLRQELARLKGWSDRRGATEKIGRWLKQAEERVRDSERMTKTLDGAPAAARRSRNESRCPRR